MKIKTFLNILVIILIIIAAIFFKINHVKFFVNNREIIQKQIDTLEFCGIIEKTQYRPVGKGYPYFMIKGKWFYIGVGGGVNYFVGDSSYKKAGSNIIKIYHKDNNWEEEIIKL